MGPSHPPRSASMDCHRNIFTKGGSDLPSPLQQALQHCLQIVRPDPHHNGFCILIGQSLHDVCDAFNIQPSSTGYTGRCCGLSQPLWPFAWPWFSPRLLRMSPTTISLTPPSCFLSAVSRLHLMASNTSTGISSLFINVATRERLRNRVHCPELGRGVPKSCLTVLLLLLVWKLGSNQMRVTSPSKSNGTVRCARPLGSTPVVCLSTPSTLTTFLMPL